MHQRSCSRDLDPKLSLDIILAELNQSLINPYIQLYSGLMQGMFCPLWFPSHICNILILFSFTFFSHTRFVYVCLFTYLTKKKLKDYCTLSYKHFHIYRTEFIQTYKKKSVEGVQLIFIFWGIGSLSGKHTIIHWCYLQRLQHCYHSSTCRFGYR